MRRLLACLPLTCIALALVVPAPADAQRSRRAVPAEPLFSFVKRFEAAMTAIRTGNCARFRALNYNGSFDEFVCTARQARTLDNFQLLGYNQYDTGAVIDYVSRDFRTLRPARASLVALLASDRRFDVVGTPIFGAGRGIRQLGTRATRRTIYLSQRTANLAISSLRTGNCRLFFLTWFTGSIPRAQACSVVFGSRPNASVARQLRIRLGFDKAYQPVSIGGSRDIQFFSVVTQRGRRYTLAVDRSGSTGNLYLTSARFLH